MAPQASLLDLLRSPPVARPVDPDGPVVQGEPDETLTLPHPRMAWPLARIELHRHDDGLWMWSVSSACTSSYKVGPKWGRFAQTRDDALFHAAQELLSAIGRLSDISGLFISAAQVREIDRWARGLSA